jgi:hypothetical protein
MEEARRAAQAQRVALNQLIDVAVAEKLSALRTEEFFQERASRADRKETLRILKKADASNDPMPGEEFPAGRTRKKRKSRQRIG